MMPKKKNPPTTLGQRIRAARKAAGLTQTQLAEQVGLVQSTVSDLENDARSTFWHEVDLLFRIADAVEVDPLDLTGP